MALIRCPQCGKEISDILNTCPRCGIQIDEPSINSKTNENNNNNKSIPTKKNKKWHIFFL